MLMEVAGTNFSGEMIRVPGLALQMATGLIQAQRSITRTLTGLLGRRAL